MWEQLLTAVPDFFKGLFGIVDQAVTDKDKANQLKVDILMAIVGKGATSWLAANAFTLAMLTNFALVIILSLLNRAVPEWSLLVALLWLAGPLLNVLSKETLGKIIELVKGYMVEQKKKQIGNQPVK